MVITMSKYKDLAERLRGKPPTHSTLDRYEAADAIEALYTRIEELEARLDWLIFHFDKDPKWKWYGKDVAAAIRKAKTGLKKE